MLVSYHANIRIKKDHVSEINQNTDNFVLDQCQSLRVNTRILVQISEQHRRLGGGHVRNKLKMHV